MTLTINLTAAEERRLKSMAEQAGVDQETLIRRLIGSGADASPDLPKTPKDAIAYWKAEGVLGAYGDPDIDSPELAQQLRRQAETRGCD